MLGPNKMLKCYISCDGDSALLGDTTQVLDALLASYGSSLVPHQHSKKNHHYGTNNHYRSNNIHPLVKVTSHHGKNTHSLRGSGPPPSLRFLYEACREQRNKCGCGVTSLVCLTAYWAPEILSLLRQGLPLPYIFGVFHQALHACKKHLKSTRVKNISQPNSSAPASHVITCNSHVTNSTSHEPTSIGHVTASTAVNGHMISLKSKVLDARQARVLSFSRHFRMGSGRDKSGEEQRATANEGNPYELDQSLSLRVCPAREGAMRLAMEARLKQRLRETGQQQHRRRRNESVSKIKMPLQYCMVGKPGGQSRVVQGVVTHLHLHMLNTSLSLERKRNRIILLESDCLPSYRHLGLQKDMGHVISHDIAQLYEESNASKWLNSSVSILQQFEINILVVGGAVCPLLWEQCIGRDILVLKDVPAKTRAALSDFTGARPISYLTQCSLEVIVSGVSIEMLESGWNRPPPTFSAEHKSKPSRAPVKTYSCRLYKDASTDAPPPDVVSILLCGLSEYEVDNLQHQFTNCYHRLHWATTSSSSSSTPYLLPGGGQTEASCVAMLEKYAMEKCPAETIDNSSQLPVYFTCSWMASASLPALATTEHWKGTVYRAFSNGLRQFITRTIINARPGVGQFDAMCVLEEMVRGGEVKEEMVLDVGMCKEEMWSRTITLLETVFFSKKFETRI